MQHFSDHQPRSRLIFPHFLQPKERRRNTLLGYEHTGRLRRIRLTDENVSVVFTLGESSLYGGAAYLAFVSTCVVNLSEIESVLGATIWLERKRFRTKTRVNTVTRYYGTMRRFAGETRAASLGKDETRATRTGYTSLPRQCEQRH
ncbi:hypothetical protein AVEN_94847-1 [Araneus ventricosus]|uniref:Uncharacterized protein n=1 Tax=Araneus ventricosus TaxID=182803 RepID=A0A4Y2CPF0_ARAVE|nr:hypothetical protein AVEN_94847-1 [Araneus ventricosus]